MEILRGGPDLVIVFDHYNHVANCSPDMSKLNRILSENGIRGCIVTAWTGHARVLVQHENVLSVYEDSSQEILLLAVELEPGLHNAERVDCGVAPQRPDRHYLTPAHVIRRSRRAEL